MADIFKKWNKKIDVEGLKSDVKDVEENGGSFKEIDPGTYEVEIENMELKETKKGDPMMSLKLKILDGDFKGQYIFYNQVLTNGYGIHSANTFLRSLESGIEVEFDDFEQYNALIVEIFAEISGAYEYAIEYSVSEKDDKKFSNYKIVEIFEI